MTHKVNMFLSLEQRYVYARAPIIHVLVRTQLDHGFLHSYAAELMYRRF